MVGGALPAKYDVGLGMYFYLLFMLYVDRCTCTALGLFGNLFVSQVSNESNSLFVLRLISASKYDNKVLQYHDR